MEEYALKIMIFLNRNEYIVHKKIESINEEKKKQTTKKIKFTKKWFVENFDEINMYIKFEEKYGIIGNPREISIEYLTPNKEKYNNILFDEINNFYIDKSKSKRKVNLI